MTEGQDPQKILAKKKRIIMEVAGQIHDVVEETLWSDYQRLPELSQSMLELMADLQQFKQQQGL
nr:CCE_0567 family metalloprotein [uncultured Tolumonas sp.]